MAINYKTRQAIIAQALREIDFARRYKQGKIKNWKINEDLYYGRKLNQEYARANVDLGQMQSFVHTILSKIDNPLTFKYTKRKDSQFKRVTRLNGVRTHDQQDNDWDIKDIAGKKQAVIYGRSIFSYFASSEGGYKANLDNVDVYDFLIDPAAGGIDTEKAMYLGDYGVVLTKKQIKDGVKDGIYLRTEATTLIDGQSNATEVNQEETNKLNRTAAQNVYQTNKDMSGSDKFKFWRWGTTYEGERYYLLLAEKGATAIRVEPIKEVFESGLWWYWTYAAFPDLTEFWTPSFCDYVREIFMAQAVSINQMLDNGEQITKPQKIVNVGAIENLAELKYRRDGIIKVKKDFDASKAIQFVATTSIDTPLKVFDKLDQIRDKASGVTAGSQGASEDDKVGIYEGNQANAADRFGYFNKSYAFGYKRFAKLHEWGVREHLTKKIAIDILGPDGVELEEVSRKDIFWKNDQFGLMVEASNAELALSMTDKKNKLTFLTDQSKSGIQNGKKAYEISASIVGFTEEEIKQLMDTSEFGDAGLMSEAERDIELILDGKNIKPNQAATTAYKQRFVDYMTDNEENITDEEFDRMSRYVKSLDAVIRRNAIRMANDLLMKEELAKIRGMSPSDAVDGAPAAGSEIPTPEMPAEMDQAADYQVEDTQV